MAQLWATSQVSSKEYPARRSLSIRESSSHQQEPRQRLRVHQFLLHLIIVLSICIEYISCQQYQRPIQYVAPVLQSLSKQRMISTNPTNVGVSQLSQQSRNSDSTIASQPPTLLSVSQGPGVDLVALNWRRFELEHGHHNEHETTGEDLKRGELIESQVAAIPDLILSRLPDEVNRQIIESLSADPSIILGPREDPAGSMAAAAAVVAVNRHSEDPDGASIERLTKSCLTIQASSLTPEQLNVTFHLYTRRNPIQSYIVRPQADRDELLRSSPFNPRQPIKWITHGFHTNVDKSEWMLEAKDKILAHEDANVFLTDWRRGASPALAFYPKAAANAHVVARMIVKILRRLWTDINLSQVHLIGHSLGAHIMGFVGSAFTEEFLHKQQQVLALKRGNGKAYSLSEPPPPLTPSAVNNQLIGRITACDPALPCFGPSSQAPNSKMSGTLTMEHIKGVKFKRPPTGLSRLSINQRFKRQALQQPNQATNNLLGGLLADDWTPTMWTHLRPDSAILVEVMHSNPGVMGYAEPLGDFDFYPNGSERQPGCSGGHGGGGGGGGGFSQHSSVPQSTARQLTESTSGHRIRRRGDNIIGKRQLGLVGQVMKTVANYNQQQISIETGEITRGAGGTGISDLGKSLGAFMKPIRDFFHTYTCSHHRSVEYMVESLYYDKIDPKNRFNKELVCQLVGYRCADYKTFKRGHCFLCRNEYECRSLAMSTEMSAFERSEKAEQFRMGQQPLAANFAQEDLAANAMNYQQKQTRLPSMERQIGGMLRDKRILPTLNQYKQNYKPDERSQYFFDTKPARNFCLHHYHLFVKYRWLRIRQSVLIDRLRLGGTVNNLLVHHPLTFHKFTHHSYTMLLTHADFLGQIETLILYGPDGDRLKTQYIEYIDITYMSNIDPLVRATNSARLCRASQSGQQQPRQDQLSVELSRLLDINNDPDPSQRWTTDINLFVRCSQDNLLVR